MNSSNLTASEITRLAAAGVWVQKLNASNDPALTDDWMEWCRSDPLNLTAFEQMQNVWDGFPAAKREAPPYPQPSKDRSMRRARLVRLAAGVLLIVGVAGWFALRYAQTETFDTARGQQRRESLLDGSALDLAPDSRVSIRYTAMRRDVQLERGQAFFAVAHSAMRPFVVHANGVTVTAIGTAFDVRTGPGNTVVTVSEGHVNVASSPNEAARAGDIISETVRAGVGQRVIFSQPAHSLSVASIDPKLAGAWRNGTLQFVGETLGDVVADVNRYIAQRITLASALQHTRFTGTVSPANVVDWLKALEQIFPVEVAEQGAGDIQIKSREAYVIHK
ncbi:MAG TPA: FecR domain-containing protein [Steroidobacteraceae bacterium]